MKKIIFAAALCFASSVSFAASSAVCATGTGTAVGSSTTTFVKTGFTPKCSANTSVYFDQGNTAAAIGAISTKGNQSFGGHTQGGAVTKYADCPTTGCTTTQAGAAADASMTAASSL